MAASITGNKDYVNSNVVHRIIGGRIRLGFSFQDKHVEYLSEECNNRVISYLYYEFPSVYDELRKKEDTLKRFQR